MALISFTVIGSGEFPFDMLRYDECRPSSGTDAERIGLDTKDMRAMDSRRKVRLQTNRVFGPTYRRWESFGWSILKEDRE